VNRGPARSPARTRGSAPDRAERDHGPPRRVWVQWRLTRRAGPVGIVGGGCLPRARADSSTLFDSVAAVCGANEEDHQGRISPGETMPLIYRSMQTDGDWPRIGRSATSLG